MKFYDNQGNTFDKHEKAMASNVKNMVLGFVDRFKKGNKETTNGSSTPEASSSDIDKEKYTIVGVDTGISDDSEDNNKSSEADDEEKCSTCDKDDCHLSELTYEKDHESPDDVKEKVEKAFLKMESREDTPKTLHIENDGRNLVLRDAEGNVVEKSKIDDRLKIKRDDLEIKA